MQPKDKFRYALTGRFIKPENIDGSEHWKGEFTIAPDKVYDGDLALFRENYPDVDEDEEDEGYEEEEGGDEENQEDEGDQEDEDDYEED